MIPKISDGWKFVWSRTICFYVGYYIIMAFVSWSPDPSLWHWFNMEARGWITFGCVLTFGVTCLIRFGDFDGF